MSRASQSISISVNGRVWRLMTCRRNRLAIRDGWIFRKIEFSWWNKKLIELNAVKSDQNLFYTRDILLIHLKLFVITWTRYVWVRISSLILYPLLLLINNLPLLSTLLANDLTEKYVNERFLHVRVGVSRAWKLCSMCIIRFLFSK